MKLSPCNTPRIVILGGGVVGLLLATRLGPWLARMRGRVTLVDRSWTHVWKPMLHTFAAGTWNVQQQQLHYLLHARTHDVEYVPGHLEAIDRTAKRVRLAPMHGAGEAIADARELQYDVLILAFGSRANEFGTPGVAEHCHFIDSQDQADTFNARLRAYVARSVFQNRVIDIAIVGGGATGVELAADLSRTVEFASLRMTPRTNANELAPTKHGWFAHDAVDLRAQAPPTSRRPAFARDGASCHCRASRWNSGSPAPHTPRRQGTAANRVRATVAAKRVATVLSPGYSAHTGDASTAHRAGLLTTRRAGSVTLAGTTA